MTIGISREEPLGCTVRRPGFWAVLLVSLTCGWAVVAWAAPNIVIITTDDAGYNEFGFMNELTGLDTQIETPNLDALAQQSVVARNGYVSSPLCAPSRAGLLTGQYQQRHGFEYNLLDMASAPPQHGLSADQITIAQQLKPLGYSTGMIGKWHNGYTDNFNLPLDKGFDEFYGLFGSSRSYFWDGHPERAIRLGDGYYENEHFAGGRPYDQNDPTSNDPVRGRYVTDAFGDEAVDFINHHAGEQNPYFLYLALTAPHDLYQAKQADLDHFAHITDSTSRLKAAMLRAVDRTVGRVVEAANASGEDTIFVFVNDNGGTSYSNNQPLSGYKGFTWEGGIKVPFFIKAPGLQPGVFDAPISSIDILPTLVAAAGGDVSTIDTDGVNLMPHLSGADPDDPHETLFWRMNGSWAVRKGDWKYGNFDYTSIRLVNLATDPGETINVAAQHPDVVEELTRDLTYWESGLDKPKWHDSRFVVNSFDHFVFRGNSAWFNTVAAFMNAATGEVATLTQQDSHPNLILEFRTKDGFSYGGFNSLTRLTWQTFMLNELRLTGNFTTPFSTVGGFNGNPMLLVKNLDGELPKIRLDATSSNTTAKFRFEVSTELQLLDDLEITGNGTQTFNFNGGIRDFYEPRNVTKTGASAMTLTGNNTFRGNLVILDGQVRLNGASAAINGAGSITIGTDGSLVQDSGLIATHTIANYSGGSFQFNGGELRVVDYIGSLTNSQAGNYSPGDSPALSTIWGDFTQSGAGKLTMELGGTTPGVSYDQLYVDGSAALGGTLQINLIDGAHPSPGDHYDLILTYGGIHGTFANTILPTLEGAATWRLEYNDFSLQLIVGLPADTVRIPGDYNSDGRVDAADYVAWRNTVASANNLLADGNGNGTVDDGDYQIWQANFGSVVQPPGSLPGDFNGDQAVDAADYVVWRNSLNSTTLLAADGNSNGTVDDGDYQIWQANFGSVVQPPESLPGDFNGDHAIDAADYVVWRNSLNSTTLLAADGNGSGMVDDGDYQIWRANFGSVVSSGSGDGGVAGVPEPGALALGVLAGLGMVVAAARRRPVDLMKSAILAQQTPN